MDLLAEQKIDTQSYAQYADSTTYFKSARERMDLRLKKIRGENDDKPTYMVEKSRDGYNA